MKGVFELYYERLNSEPAEKRYITPRVFILAGYWNMRSLNTHVSVQAKNLKKRFKK